MLNAETERRREGFDSSEVVNELDSFLGEAVNLVICPAFLDYRQGFQLFKIFDQSVVREVRTVQDSSRFSLVALTLNNSHDIHVDP